MAEHSTQPATAPAGDRALKRSRALALALVLALGAFGLATPHLGAVSAEPAAIAAAWTLRGGVAEAVGRRRRRWAKLRSALSAIRRAPSSRPDTPTLPTVGRPRDGPGYTTADVAARLILSGAGERRPCVVLRQ